MFENLKDRFLNYVRNKISSVQQSQSCDKELDDVQKRLGEIIKNNAWINLYTDIGCEKKIQKYFPSQTDKYILQIYQLIYNQTEQTLHDIYILILLVYLYRLKKQDHEIFIEILQLLYQKNVNEIFIRYYLELIEEFHSINNIMQIDAFFKQQKFNDIKNIYFLLYLIDYFIQNQNQFDIMTNLKFDYENLNQMLEIIQKTLKLNIVAHFNSQSKEWYPNLQFIDKINFVCTKNKYNQLVVGVLNYDQKKEKKEKHCIIENNQIQIPHNEDYLQCISILNDIQQQMPDAIIDQLIESYIFDTILFNIKFNDDITINNMKMSIIKNQDFILNPLSSLKEFMNEIEQTAIYQKYYKNTRLDIKIQNNPSRNMKYMEMDGCYYVIYEQKNKNYEDDQFKQQTNKKYELYNQNQLNQFNDNEYEIHHKEQQNIMSNQDNNKPSDYINSINENRQQLNNQHLPQKITQCIKCKQRSIDLIYEEYKYCQSCFMKIALSYI